MIKKLNSKVFFFLIVLISFIPSALNAQVPLKDTLKKVTADTLMAPDEEGEIQNRITYGAEDSVVYLASDSKVLLYGKSHVEYESMNLKAEFIEIDYEKNVVTAYGKKDSAGKSVGTPVFKDGEQEMNAEKIMYNLKTKKGKIFNALTKQGELLVIGQEIKKDSSNIIYMKDMRCIPCQYEDARTVFKATKAKIIPDDKIVTGPMYLEIGGVPTPLGLPFGYFPNTKKQHNGILLPFVGNSPAQGFNLRDGGFYWGINDKTDMIIRGDIYANGSWALRTNNNYLVLYKANGAVNLGYSEFNIGDRDIPAQYSKQKAYTVGWLHNQDNKNNPTVRFSANVNYVNNQKFNRLNALNSGEFLNNTFQSNINFTKTFKLSSLSLNAMHSQNSISNQVDVSFPSLTFNVNRFFPFKRENAVRQNVFDKIGVNYLLEARNTLSGADSTIFKGDIESRLKYGIKHSLPISTNFNLFKYITVTPALNLSSVMYTKSTRKEFVYQNSIGNIKTDTVSGFAAGYDANFSTALNTKVFFDYVFKRGKLQQIRHLLIPTISYLYRPDFGEEQYGFWKKIQTDSTGKNFTRYSIFDNTLFGGPAIGEQNALSINLNNNIEAKMRRKTDTGFVYNKATLLQNLSLSTAYNFAADSFGMSNISVSARTKLFKYFDVVGFGSFDPYAYDKQFSRRLNQFAYDYNGQLARFTTANLALNTSLSSNQLEAMKKTREAPNMTNAAERGGDKGIEKEEKLPWNLSVYYNLTFDNNAALSNLKLTQTANFNGDISPTKYWKLGITSGYDFTNKRLSYTSINIYRDLKCWEARIDWIPFGVRKSYNLTINLKSSMLRDFKIPRQRQWYDNF